jgi:NitT/TauT family transport system permease protein
MKHNPLPAALLLVAIAVLLELGSRGGLINGNALPAPSRIAAGLADVARNGELVRPALITFGLMLASTTCACLVGIPIGIVLSRSAAFGAAYESWLGGLFAAPLVLFYPVFLVIFHRTYLMVIVMSAITASLPVIIQTRLGMLQIPAVLRAVGRSFNLSKRQQFWLVELPAAVPAIVTGVRLSIIYSLVSVIGLEFLIDFGGLGKVISDLYAQYDIPQMYAEIGVVIVISAAILWLLDRVERWLRPA